MYIDICPNVRDLVVVGDTRIDREHLGRVLAAKYEQRFSGVPEPVPAPRTRPRRGLVTRVVAWLRTH